MPRYRMCDEDQARYPGPEWIEYSENLLANLELDVLMDFEDTTGMTCVEFVRGFNRGSAGALRAMLWLGRKLDGCTDKWETFLPYVLKIEREREGMPAAADADPPAVGGE